MTEIKAVHPQKDYRLEVILDNGSNIVLNMQPKLHTMRFGLRTKPTTCLIWDDKRFNIDR